MTIDEAKQIVLAKHPRARIYRYGSSYLVVDDANGGKRLDKFPGNTEAEAWISAAELIEQQGLSLPS